MNADPNKHNRQRTVKTRSRFTTLLTVYFFVALIIPNCVLANTEPYSVWTVEALILMPLGFYMMWSVALRRSGIMIWLAFPFIFLCAFQIVLPSDLAVPSNFWNNSSTLLKSVLPFPSSTSSTAAHV